MDQQYDEKTMPNQFLCPIFQQTMKDPVLTIDGFTFERRAILEWFAKGKNTNPLTNKPLASKELIQNRSLRNVIEHHSTRMRQIERVTNENVQKLIKKQNQRFATMYPELINQVGFVDLDKFSVFSNQAANLRNVLTNVKEKFGDLRKCCDKQSKGCKQCKGFIDTIRGYKNFVDRDIAETLKMGFIIQPKQIQTQKIQFFIINTEVVRGIDFRRSKRNQLKKQQFIGIMLTSLLLQQILTRIRTQSKIPSSDFIRVWITNYELPLLYDHILEQVQTITGSYLCKIKCVGKKVENWKKKYSQINIKQGEYLIIQHGPGEEYLFRDDFAKCDYCYKVKKIETDCECKKVFYCSQECKNKDKTYHDNICKLQTKAN